MQGWRVRVEHSYRFAYDELLLFIVKRDMEETRPLKPIVFELGDAIPEIPSSQDEQLQPTQISRELAEQLFEQLGYHLLGVAEPLREIHRLRRELEETKKRLDKLIDGIGRMGGNND